MARYGGLHEDALPPNTLSCDEPPAKKRKLGLPGGKGSLAPLVYRGKDFPEYITFIHELNTRWELARMQGDEQTEEAKYLYIALYLKDTIARE